MCRKRIRTEKVRSFSNGLEQGVQGEMRDEYLESDDRGELVFTHNYLEVKKASLSEVVQESDVSSINVVLSQV